MDPKPNICVSGELYDAGRTLSSHKGLPAYRLWVSVSLSNYRIKSFSGSRTIALLSRPTTQVSPACSAWPRLATKKHDPIHTEVHMHTEAHN